VQGGEERHCPRCGTPYVPGQDYCLECGLRLGLGRGLVGTLSTAWRERFAWYPGDWIWPVLFGLVIAVIGGTVAAVVADSGRGSNHPLVATHPGSPRQPVTPPVTATVALPTVPTGTLTPWPSNLNGYTVVLESIPMSGGRGLAVARAQAASRAGLPQVGVLNSNLYSSLHPGYWVVFSGIYALQTQADAAKQEAGAKGFGTAYSRQITR